MKKTIFIIGFIIAVLTFLQSSTARWAGDFFSEASLFHGGTTGRFVALFFLIASVIALFRLTLAVALFAAAGLVAIVTGILMDYYEMVFWGIISLILAVVAFMFREDEESDEEAFDEEIEDREEEPPEEPVEGFFSERELLLNKRTRHYQ